MPSATNTNSLVELSTQLAAAVERAASSIVAIRARRRIPSSGIVWRYGLIVSASHTVRRDGTVPIVLSNGESSEATVIGRDPDTDLVVLRADNLAVQPVSFASSAESAVGSFVLAVGRPGRQASASFGIVSATLPEWRTDGGRRIGDMLRLDLAVYDGFSGGPLVAASGRTIGINNSALAGGAAVAMPASVVDGVVNDLLARGHVRRPFLGVAVHPVTLSQSSGAGLATAGLVVISVADATPADAAGILVGDILLQMGEVELARPSDLLDALARSAENAEVSLELLRGGERKRLRITPADRAAGRKAQ